MAIALVKKIRDLFVKNKALFLDRDGVINEDYGYVHSPDSFDFIEGIFDVARHAYKRGYLIIVVTNQAGIARGYYSVSEFLELSDWMCSKFEAEKAPISKVYFSPYHPTEGQGEYLRDDESRKPNAGMLFEAIREFDLDPKASLLIGDQSTDILAGRLAEVGKNLLFTAGTRLADDVEPIYVISSLRQAIEYL